MENLAIGKIIYSLRKEKGITQETLANFLGVSPAAISKWESNQCYPDITLLPQMASYFDVTIDYLLNFSPAISAEATMNLYHQLSAAFVNDDFYAVYKRCKDLAKKYHNNFFMQLQLGNLLLNHFDKVPNPEKLPEIIDYTMSLYRRVIAGTTNINLVHQARYALAICYISNNKPDEAIETLDSAVDSMLPKEIILSHAYQQKSNMEKASEIAQLYAFQCLVGLQNVCPSMALMRIAEPEKCKSWLMAAEKAFLAFDFEDSNPFALATFYLSYGRTLCILGEKKEALEKLARFSALATDDKNYPITFKNTLIFDCLENSLSSFDLGTTAPRSDKTIVESCLNALTMDPSFSCLKDEEEFKKISRDLKAHCRL